MDVVVGAGGVADVGVVVAVVVLAEVVDVVVLVGGVDTPSETKKDKKTTCAAMSEYTRTRRTNVGIEII